MIHEYDNQNHKTIQSKTIYKNIINKPDNSWVSLLQTITNVKTNPFMSDFV